MEFAQVVLGASGTHPPDIIKGPGRGGQSLLDVAAVQVQ
ncbi:hypothetical protein ABH917_001015 [Thermobifida halotolerans]